MRVSVELDAAREAEQASATRADAARRPAEPGGANALSTGVKFGTTHYRGAVQAMRTPALQGES